MPFKVGDIIRVRPNSHITHCSGGGWKAGRTAIVTKVTNQTVFTNNVDRVGNDTFDTGRFDNDFDILNKFKHYESLLNSSSEESRER